MFKNVLIPTDGSALSEIAVKKGIDLAQAVGARVTLLTVSEPYHVLSMDELSLADTEEKYREDAESRAAERLKGGVAYARDRGVPVDTEHAIGDHPFESIIDCATRRGNDHICMASHGRKGVAGLLLGSETHKVLTHSRIPVTVLR